jgi:hypothetical protein
VLEHGRGRDAAGLQSITGVQDAALTTVNIPKSSRRRNELQMKRALRAGPGSIAAADRGLAAHDAREV